MGSTKRRCKWARMSALPPMTPNYSVILLQVNGRPVSVPETALCAAASELQLATAGYVDLADYSDSVASVLAALEGAGLVRLSSAAVVGQDPGTDNGAPMTREDLLARIGDSFDGLTASEATDLQSALLAVSETRRAA